MRGEKPGSTQGSARGPAGTRRLIPGSRLQGEGQASGIPNAMCISATGTAMGFLARSSIRAVGCGRRDRTGSAVLPAWLRIDARSFGFVFVPAVRGRDPWLVLAADLLTADSPQPQRQHVRQEMDPTKTSFRALDHSTLKPEKTGRGTCAPGNAIFGIQLPS